MSPRRAAHIPASGKQPTGGVPCVRTAATCVAGKVLRRVSAWRPGHLRASGWAQEAVCRDSLEWVQPTEGRSCLPQATQALPWNRHGIPRGEMQKGRGTCRQPRGQGHDIHGLLSVSRLQRRDVTAGEHQPLGTGKRHSADTSPAPQVALLGPVGGGVFGRDPR